MEPVTLPLLTMNETRESHIEVLERPEMALVAVLELLSPENKREPGYGRCSCTNETGTFQHVTSHVTELDLLLGGRRLPLQCKACPTATILPRFHAQGNRSAGR